MKSQIEAIRAHEIVKTARALENLKKELVKIKKRELEQTREKLHGLALEISSIKRKEFSFMKIFGLEHDEQVHSSFLAWLLDPLESHGLGSLFVKEFLKKIGIKIDELDFSRLRIEREISSDKSRLDIGIFDSHGKFQCIIENKIWSSEGIDQTTRLYSDFHNENYEKELFVFLTLDKKSKPKNKYFISMNYEQVLPILTKILDMAKGDTRFLIKHYANTLERLIMSEKFEGFSERTQMYYQFYKDTTEIRKAFEKDRKLLLETLEEAIRDNTWWDDDVWKLERRGGDILLLKDSWRLDKNEGMYIQLVMYVDSPGFAIRIYGEPSRFAAKLMPFFKKLIDEKYPGKTVDGVIKRFSSGVTRFLEKEIKFSLTEKTQIKKILENLNKIIELFDETMIKAINELKQKK
ncbi:MAG: PD-(D/E)XK nuclease family protein [Candidatus Bathyarchaeota archaeon]